MTREKFIAGLYDLMNWPDFVKVNDDFLYLRCRIAAEYCFTNQIEESEIVKELRVQLQNIQTSGRFKFSGDAN